MCGRYAFYLPPSELKKRFNLENLINFPASYNCAPMQNLPVIVKNRMGLARWGFLPPWKKEDDKGFAARMINARSETVAEKPAFRENWSAARRCLIPANGFYEWKKDENTAVNTPYYISHKNGLIGFAGLWSKVDNLVTFTILTKPAGDEIASLHHRMPVIFTPEQASQWFSADLQGAADMIRNVSASGLNFHRAHTDVGKVSNDDAYLIEKQAV